MNKEFQKYHGIALTRLIHFEKTKSINQYDSALNSAYIVNNELGVYIKYSCKRMSPWTFTFKKEHQDEIFEMKQLLNEAFVVLVCGEDGIACISFNELKQILDGIHEDTEWVSVGRRPKEMYRVSGPEGKLEFKVADNAFPKKLFD